MATVVNRVPPPPPIAVNDPVFNHWLHDLTAFLKAGGIDTSTIPGYDQMVVTVATHTTEIAINTTDINTNEANIAANSSTIAAHTSQINANTTNISNNTTNISTLAARSQVRNGTAAPAAGLGVNGDWFADTTAKHIYVKVAGAWVQIV